MCIRDRSDFASDRSRLVKTLMGQSSLACLKAPRDERARGNKFVWNPHLMLYVLHDGHGAVRRALLTSANLSAAAWGRRRSANDPENADACDAKGALEIRSFELGVCVPVAPDAGDGSPVRDLTSTLDKIADGAANPFAEGDERRRAAAKASAGPDDRRPADDRRRSFDGRPRRARSEGGGALAGAEGRPRRANSDGDRFASPWPDIISLIEEGPKSRRRRSHDEGPAS